MEIKIKITDLLEKQIRDESDNQKVSMKLLCEQIIYQHFKLIAPKERKRGGARTRKTTVKEYQFTANSFNY